MYIAQFAHVPIGSGNATASYSAAFYACCGNLRVHFRIDRRGSDVDPNAYELDTSRAEPLK
jgi:hypothetical protein